MKPSAKILIFPFLRGFRGSLILIFVPFYSNLEIKEKSALFNRHNSRTLPHLTVLLSSASLVPKQTHTLMFKASLAFEIMVIGLCFGRGKVQQPFGQVQDAVVQVY